MTHGNTVAYLYEEFHTKITKEEKIKRGTFDLRSRLRFTKREEGVFVCYLIVKSTHSFGTITFDPPLCSLSLCDLCVKLFPTPRKHQSHLSTVFFG